MSVFFISVPYPNNLRRQHRSSKRWRTKLEAVKPGLLGAVYTGLFSITLFVSGCGSTTEITKPVDIGSSSSGEPISYVVAPVNSLVEGIPESFIVAVRSDLEIELQRLGLLNGDDTGRYTVQIQISDYRMRSSGARFFFGVLAGKDLVKSKVKVVDQNNGTLVAESEVSTHNSTAVGGPNMVASMHGKEIAKFLTTKK